MGQFVDAPTRTRTELPDDLPDALKAFAEGRKAGAAFRSNDGNLYRLVPATWRLDSRAKPSDGKAEAKSAK